MVKLNKVRENQAIKIKEQNERLKVLEDKITAVTNGWAATNNTLAETQAELKAKGSEIASVNAGWSATNSSLTKAEFELVSVKGVLDQVNSTATVAQTALEDAQNEIEVLTNGWAATNNTLAETQASLATIQNAAICYIQQNQHLGCEVGGALDCPKAPEECPYDNFLEEHPTCALLVFSQDQCSDGSSV